MKKLCKSLALFCMGGGLYVLIELLARGRSHWTMALLGGACFLLIGAINERVPWKLGLLWQMPLAAGSSRRWNSSPG